MDFDYYCIYGPSSYNYLKKLKPSIGSPIFIQAGSYLFDKYFHLPKPHKNMPVLLLGMGPSMENSTYGQSIYQIVIDWQKKYQQKLYIRLHPRSDGQFWKKFLSDNIEICHLKYFQESLSKSCLVISGYTNAFIDAALLYRPSILLDFNKSPDFIEIERFFCHKVSNADNLNSAINCIKDNMNEYIIKCNNFCDYHLPERANSLNCIISNIKMIIKHEKQKDQMLK